MRELLEKEETQLLILQETKKEEIKDELCFALGGIKRYGGRQIHLLKRREVC